MSNPARPPHSSPTTSPTESRRHGRSARFDPAQGPNPNARLQMTSDEAVRALKGEPRFPRLKPWHVVAAFGLIVTIWVMAKLIPVWSMIFFMGGGM